MTRAKGATLTAAQNYLAKIEIFLCFLEPLFCAPYNHKPQSCINTARISNTFKSGVLRQHQPACYKSAVL